MKTATMPALRVQPELREAAEAALRPGETLSGFVEDALRRNVALRRAQDEFVARGLASRVAAKKTGDYLPAADVLATLASRLAKKSAPTPTEATRSARSTRKK